MVQKGLNTCEGSTKTKELPLRCSREQATKDKESEAWCVKRLSTSSAKVGGLNWNEQTYFQFFTKGVR